jgi:saccharopine dehydrogenase (NAD+, L-lysine-forming)
MDSPRALHPRVERIAVVGLGKVGRLTADMLVERGFEVQEVDADASRATGEGAAVMDVSDVDALEKVFAEADVDAAICCLPYYLTAGTATAAHAAGAHYFDLSEDVGASAVVKELAGSADTVFVPRCGLAPGFICVVGGALAARLETVDRIQLRVGALPRTPNNAIGYACNWSADGLVNEYLNDCEQLRDGELVTVPSLSDLETIVIDGATYEAFTTSGGLGTMCETFAGRVDSLDYKTIRYPGHRHLMRFMLRELGLGRQRDEAVRILAEAYPPVEEDLVVLYGAAEGTNAGRRAREEFVRVYRPRLVAGAIRTTIAWTTSAGVVGMIELLAQAALPASGMVRQEDVPLDAFLSTSAGQLLAREPHADVGDDVLVPVA